MKKQLNKFKKKINMLTMLASLLTISVISSCKNTQKDPSKDLCYGVHLEYFYNGIDYSIAEKDAKIANNEFACDKCIDRLTYDEQSYCVD